MNTEVQNGVRKETIAGALTVDSVYEGEYQKEGTKTAQLRQTYVTKSHYPTKQVSTNLQDNPFSATDFGFEEQTYETTENRVAWIDVPAAISNTDDVLNAIAPGATLYKMLSNRPILSDSQKYAIDQGLRSMADFAESQIVRYPDNHPDAGQIIPDPNGKPQYRAVFFSNSPKEDVDLRNENAEDFYVSDALKAEMAGAGAVVNQSLGQTTL